MIQWLYRYVFRGIGVVLVIGMITLLILAISAQSRRSDNRPAAPSYSDHR
jgi:hypothetical protein